MFGCLENKWRPVAGRPSDAGPAGPASFGLIALLFNGDQQGYGGLVVYRNLGAADDLGG